MAHVGSFSHFVFVIAIVIVFVSACVFFIDITGASVDSTCHELSEYVWLYGSVNHILLIQIFSTHPSIHGWTEGGLKISPSKPGPDR